MLSGANRRAPNIVHTTAFRAWIGAWSVRRSNCVHDELREVHTAKDRFALITVFVERR